jgi:uncharacterized protein (TIGR00369 family)
MDEGTDPDIRRRTIRWEDPRGALEQAATMDGLRYLRAMAEGQVPRAPIAELMGIEVVELEEGRAVFSVEPAEYHYNPVGTVHGGLPATMLDSVAGCAVHTTLPAGVGYATTDLHVQYLRAITKETGRLIATGDVEHRGRTLSTARASLIDAEERLVATAVATCMIIRPDGGG